MNYIHNIDRYWRDMMREEWMTMVLVSTEMYNTCTTH